ncbi:MAG: hydrogenase maturation nickel metallochaperone HypA, partial [Anaerolineae bacterium]
MHELSVTESLLEIALRHAARAGAARITRLNIVVGELSSIVDESVQFYWDIVSRGTMAEGAELHFERVDGTL